MTEQNIKKLMSGGIGVIPTDTIYGLVGQALKPATVERIYKVRQRQPAKPLIILIASVIDLQKFGIELSASDQTILNKYWPGAVSIILPCPDDRFAYLHRGTQTLAFRLPDNSALKDLLSQTGPLVAPSANPEGQTSAAIISEAQEYFGEQVDFYEDAGRLESQPSTLIKLEDGRIQVLRQGAVKI